MSMLSLELTTPHCTKRVMASGTGWSAHLKSKAEQSEWPMELDALGSRELSFVAHDSSDAVWIQIKLVRHFDDNVHVCVSYRVCQYTAMR